MLASLLRRRSAAKGDIAELSHSISSFTPRACSSTRLGSVLSMPTCCRGITPAYKPCTRDPGPARPCPTTPGRSVVWPDGTVARPARPAGLVPLDRFQFPSADWPEYKYVLTPGSRPARHTAPCRGLPCPAVARKGEAPFKRHGTAWRALGRSRGLQAPSPFPFPRLARPKTIRSLLQESKANRRCTLRPGHGPAGPPSSSRRRRNPLGRPHPPLPRLLCFRRTAPEQSTSFRIAIHVVSGPGEVAGVSERGGAGR